MERPAETTYNGRPPTPDELLRVGEVRTAARPVRLAADETAPRLARALMYPLRTFGGGQLHDDAELLVSELVTNVVRHTRCTDTTVSVSIFPTAARVEVLDADPTMPHPVDRDSTEPGGLGLHIVDMVSTRWGVEPMTEGKVVWFELSLEPSDRPESNEQPAPIDG